MHARGPRQVLEALRAIFQKVRDAEFGCDVDTLGHLEALDQLLQDERRRGIVCGHVVPLFLASSVFVKKPERVIALSFIMVLCLLVYRLVECLPRRQLAATEQTIPNQVNKPTNSPTMR